MNWRFFAAFLAFLASACVCYAAEKSHEPEHEGEGHEGHTHGGALFEGETPVAVSLTAGGTILVAFTLLALLWKPIDAAFRRSRFRSRWQQRPTRVAFAIATAIVCATAVGGITYLRMDHADHDHHDGEPAELRPMHGGVVTNADRFVFEMVARRTGELRLYITPLSGDRITSWDVKGNVTVPASVFSPSAKITTDPVLPVKVNLDASFFGAYTLPFQARQVSVHLALKIKEQTFQLDFNLPVQD